MKVTDAMVMAAQETLNYQLTSYKLCWPCGAVREIIEAALAAAPQDTKGTIEPKTPESTVKGTDVSHCAAPPVEDVIEIDENGVVHALGPQAARDLSALTKMSKKAAAPATLPEDTPIYTKRDVEALLAIRDAAIEKVRKGE